MHKLKLLFIAVCLSFGISAFAQQYTATFVVGEDICAPITVRYCGKTYTVYSSLTVEQASGYCSATDCQGRKLKYEFSTKGGTSGGQRFDYDTYTFYALEPDFSSGSSSSSGNYSSGGGRNSYNNNDAWAETGRRAGEALAGLMFGTGGGAQGQAYPGFHVQTGLSKGYGEFMRLRIALSGFNLYGGIGKDWLFDGVNKDKFLWHVGMGGYYAFGGDYDDPSMDCSFGLTFAENAAYDDYSLMIDLDYTYWLGRWRRVGIFAGGGIGWGHIKHLGEEDYHTRFAWNLEAGIAFRIAHF